MSLPDITGSVKVELNKTDLVDETPLRAKIAAAWQEIERRIGHVDVKKFTQTVEVGCDGTAELDETPVLDVSSVLLLAADGTVATDLGAGTNVAASGVLHRLPRGTVQITYTAGLALVPADVVEAAVQLSAHLWRQSRSLTEGGRIRSELPMGPGMASAMPNRVKDLLGLVGKSSRSRVFVG